MTIDEATWRISAMKDVAYVDKVYAGIGELRRRAAERTDGPIDLRLAELRLFSQNGEDGVTFELLRHLPEVPWHFVEFGVGDGWSCNTRLLAEVLGWSGTYFEIDADSHAALAARYVNARAVRCIQAEMTPDNVNEQFERAGVPHDLGVLCIDIDGQDYWVWQAVASVYRPAVVIAEVNLSLGLDVSVTESLGAPQDRLTETFGTSLRAMAALAARKGYRLVHVELAGVNAFFLRDDLLADREIRGIVDRSPNYGLRGRFHSLDRLYGDGPRTPRPTTPV